MTIKFNEVTWYSKLAAVVLFIFIIPALTFYLGEEYQKTSDVLASVSNYQVPKTSNDNIATDNDGMDDEHAFLQADYNFDGIPDRLKMLDCGATGNCSYEVDLYDAKTKNYLSVRDGEMSFEVTNPVVNKTEQLVCSFANVGAGTYHLSVFRYKTSAKGFELVKEFDGSTENVHGCTLK